jgi:membrane protein DedA with SNARE-associated domain
MDIQMLTDCFHQYGPVVIFVIVFLEYLNLPGFPAGVILPLAGIWAYQGGIGLGMALLLSVLAGLCGSWVLYWLGRLGGEFFLNRYVHKFPKQKNVIKRTMERIRKKGYICIFICKLIPMIRTVISIPAGVLKMDFVGYTLFSAMGITIWNLAFVGAGYFFGESILQLLS